MFSTLESPCFTAEVCVMTSTQYVSFSIISCNPRLCPSSILRRRTIFSVPLPCACPICAPVYTPLGVSVNGCGKPPGCRGRLLSLYNRRGWEACPYFCQIRFGICIARQVEQFQLGQITEFVRKTRKPVVGKIQDL